MITYTEFTFEAAHQIPPISPLHGHTFVVDLAMTGQVDPHFGWSANLDEVERVVERLKKQIDHSYLNSIPGLEVPSLENVARWIWGRVRPELPGLIRVGVRRGAMGHGEGCIYDGRSERLVSDPQFRIAFAEAS
jgi:6-pyruvoyltetrahydropterin/6-carboxytetrahydropterin synthase